MRGEHAIGVAALGMQGSTKAEFGESMVYLSNNGPLIFLKQFLSSKMAR